MLNSEITGIKGYAKLFPVLFFNPQTVIPAQAGIFLFRLLAPRRSRLAPG
jgi:hypothetical protein